VKRAEADRYLSRFGARRPDRPTDAALRELHAAHLHHVPFENLSIHLGEPIELDEASLFDKIVNRRRGGFCYELNGMFASLLTSLGFQVQLAAARVFNGAEFGPLFDHLVLHVTAEHQWLADVGFGRHSLYPLRLDTTTPQVDPDGTFTVVTTTDGDVDVLRDGKPQYRVETRTRPLSDFLPMCWWHQTSPASHFTRSLTCSLRTDTGRVTLSDHTLITTTDAGREEQELADDGAILNAYRRYFGINLDRAPHLRPAV
jgi:N-hydroxyarylamine O-acetyltransferase